MALHRLNDITLGVPNVADEPEDLAELMGAQH